jgi:cell division protein FtsW (lipid II flippase)
MSLAFLGVLMIVSFSFIQTVVIPVEQREFSYFLKHNFTRIVGCVFFIVGFLIGYFLKLNPWYAGLSIFSVFPITSLIEAVTIQGSHNLIPFEFIGFFLYSLPTILAVYAGRFLSGKTGNRNTRSETKESQT